MKANETRIDSSSTHAEKHSFFGKGDNAVGEPVRFFGSSREGNSFFNASSIQPKLTVGKPNDPYEREADAMADQVVQKMGEKESGPGSTLIQPQCNDCGEEEKLQRKAIFESNEDVPLQRKEQPGIVMRKTELSAVREAEEEVEKKSGEASPEKLQLKPLAEANPPKPRPNSEPAAHLPLKTTTPAPAAVQAKCESCAQEESVKEQASEGKLLRTKIFRKPIFDTTTNTAGLELNASAVDSGPWTVDSSLIQRRCRECEEGSIVLRKAQHVYNKAEDSPAPSNVERQLSSSKNSGQPLPESTRSGMEQSFGTDFSGVRVHTDSSAVQMNRDLNAQAFTHGSDIYFNSGKFDSDSTAGKHLLAHELTHTIQQGASRARVQRHPVAGTDVRRRNRDAIFGVGATAGMNLDDFKTYTAAQADWFTEPSLTAADRADLWTLLLKTRPGSPVLAGVGDVQVSELRTVTPLQWPDLEKYCRGCDSNSHTVRITRSGPLADRITLGHTLGQVEAVIPGIVLEVTITQAQLQTIQTDALVPALTTYWTTFHPHLQQNLGSAASMPSGMLSEAQLLLDFLRGPNIGPFGALLGKMRNLHRFSTDALTQIKTNFADFSRTKPVYLLLYSGHDANGAFIKSRPLFENLMKDRTKLVLMLEGQASLQDIIDKVPDIARDYGMPDASGTHRIAQVMIAGHGGSRGLELAGSDAPTITASGEVDYNSSRSQDMDLDRNAAQSEELLRRLIDNMDPATARIVYAGCLVGSTSVPVRTPAGTDMTAADISAHVTNPANQSLADVTRHMGAARGRPGMVVEGGRGSVALGASTSLQDRAGNLHIEYNFDAAAFGTELQYLNSGREPEGVMRAAVQVAVTSTPVNAANQLRLRRPHSPPGWYDNVTAVFVRNALDGVAVGSGIDIVKVNKLADLADPFFLSYWSSRSIASFGRVNAQGALTAQLYNDVLGLSEMTAPADFRTKQGRFIMEMGWAMLDHARAGHVITYLDGRADLVPGILERHLTGRNLGWINLSGVSAALFPAGAAATDGRIRLALAWISVDNNNADVRAFLDARVDTSGASPRLQAPVVAQLSSPADENEILRILGRLTTTVPSASGAGPSLPAANADVFPNSGSTDRNDVRIEPNEYVATVIAPAYSLNVRTRPSMAGVPFHWLSRGDTVNVMGFVHNWAAVDINGKLGFAHRNFLSPPP